MIAIKGLRGVGKTTMILQHIKFFSTDVAKSLYVTADHPWFYNHNTLKDLIFKASNGWMNKVDLTGYGENANWMDMTASLGTESNAKGGITIFDHTSNLRFPSPWYIWYGAG